MTSLGGLPQAKVLFQQAMQDVMRETQAQRGAILFGEDCEEPKPRACAVFQEHNFWLEAPLSVSVLKRVLRTGEPVAIQSVLQEAQDAEQLSLTLSNVRSLVCAPLWGPGQQISGLIYADWVEHECPVDTRRSLSRVQEVARRVEKKLFQLAGAEPALEEAIETARRPTFYRPRVVTKHQRLGAAQQKVFLRNLSILFASGVPLVQGLNTLAQGAASLPEQTAVRELSTRLQKGQSLSEALRETGVTTTLVERLVAVGERSGRLEICLKRLADYAEQSEIFRRQLVSRLVFPMLTLLFALFFCAIGPRLVLDCQASMFARLGAQYPDWLIPAVTCLRWLGSPWLWGATAGLLAVPRLRRQFLDLAGRLALRFAPVRGLWDDYQRCLYCYSLALALDAGVAAGEAVKLAGELMPEGSPFGRLSAHLHNGEALHEALRLEGISPLLMEMVKVGEESGQLPTMLNWVARQAEAELRGRLDQLLHLIQPVILCGLGLFTGLAMLVTMLPTIKAIEAL